MTPQPNSPYINDLLVLNVRDAVEAARFMVGAQSCHLQIAPDLVYAASRLSLTGLSVLVEPVATALTDADGTQCPDIMRLALPKGSPTDRLDIGVIIRAADGPPFALMKLERVPTGWAKQETLKGLSHIKAIMMQQFEALALGPALVATPMLRLCSLIRELDDQAVSHAVYGLLRVLAKEQPNRLETMAMRICGLTSSAQPCLEEREIVLGPVTLDLLDRAGIGRTSGQLAFVPEAGDCSRPAAVRAPSNLAPFAQIRVLEETFDVAEDENRGQLWFRKAGSTGEWVALAAGFADGWAPIAAEILGQTRDILRDYGLMHMIRRRDLPTDEIAEAYELDGVIWWLRNGEAGSEARLDDGEWCRLDLELDLPGKVRALQALFVLDAGVEDRLSDQAHDWVRRMARAVQVMPFVAIAAE